MFQIALLAAASLASLVLFSSTLSNNSSSAPLDDEPSALDQTIPSLRGAEDSDDWVAGQGNIPGLGVAYSEDVLIPSETQGKISEWGLGSFDTVGCLDESVEREPHAMNGAAAPDRNRDSELVDPADDSEETGNFDPDNGHGSEAMESGSDMDDWDSDPSAGEEKPEDEGVNDEDFVEKGSSLEDVGLDPSEPRSALLWELIDKLSEKKREVDDLHLPEFMDMHRMYDTSAKQAMIDLLTFLAMDPEGQTIELPLWKNRLDRPVDEANGPKICVAVVSARRKNSIFTYVVQAVSAILNRMHFQRDKHDVYLHVFNVDNEQESHKDVNLVRDIVPVTDVKIPFPREGEFPRQYNENLDNAEIIRIFNRIGCQFPIFLEDDALATLDWVESVRLAIEQLQHHTRWGIVRLYAPRGRYPPTSHRGISSYDPKFMATANLMNREFMGDFADQLEIVTMKAIETGDDKFFITKDLLGDEFCAERDLEMLSFEPVVFQHTGIYSSVNKREISEAAITDPWMSSGYFDAHNMPIEFNIDNWKQN